MSTQVGRISGPLLKADLVRNGVDLAFDTDLLFLDVNNNRIGINNDTTVRDLLVNTVIRTDNLIVDEAITAENVNITDNEISTIVNQLLLQAADAASTITVPRLRTDNLQFDQNELSNIINNNDIVINPTKNFVVNSAVEVQDNVTVTQDLLVNNGTFSINSLTLGDSTSDTISFPSTINSDILPATTAQYDIGSTLNQWLNIWLREAQISDVNFSTSLISADELILRGNSAGSVLAERLRFTNNIIESQINENLNFSISSANTIIDTNTALELAKGTFSSITQARMRFDTGANLFQGFTTANITFGGVYSDNRASRIVATPLTNEINFTINSTTAMNINPTRMFLAGLDVDDLFFDQNTITSQNNTNIVIPTSGTEVIVIDDLEIKENVIRNTNGILSLQHTGSGYLKFDNTVGFVIPSGNNSNRAPTPEQGTTRWNTQLDYLEVFIGTSWQNATTAGSSFATEEEINELNDLYVLMLG